MFKELLKVYKNFLHSKMECSSGFYFERELQMS